MLSYRLATLKGILMQKTSTIDWDLIAPPRPVVSEEAKRRAQEQFESETDEQYIGRLHREQN